MSFARLDLCASIAVVLCASEVSAQSPASAPSSNHQELIDASNAARDAGDYTTARAKASEAVSGLLTRSDGEQDAAWLELLAAAGRAAYDSYDPQTAHNAWLRLHDVRAATLPDDHADLQTARLDLAWTSEMLGDLARTRDLREKVLDVRTRTLPDDHIDLQRARLACSRTLRISGDVQSARPLQEQVIEALSRSLPDDHLDLQRARFELGVTLMIQGELERSRDVEQQVVDILSRTVPDDHPDLLAARNSLANAIRLLGDARGALPLFERLLEVRERTLPPDHTDLLKAKGNLGITLSDLGDFDRARVLAEQVLESRTRTRSDDHPDLQMARQNLGNQLYYQGDAAGATALYEKVLDVYTRTLPHDHSELQSARRNAAAAAKSLGDLSRARELEEELLEVSLRTLPDDHLLLQAARQSLAYTLLRLGHLARARDLFEKAADVLSRKLPHDHIELLVTREGLAETMYRQRDLHAARIVFEDALDTRTRTRSGDEVGLNQTRVSLGCVLHDLNDTRGSLELARKALEGFLSTLPDHHRQVQYARLEISRNLRELADWNGAREVGEKALENLLREYPEDHPTVQDARTDVALALVNLGEYSRARELLERALSARSTDTEGDDSNFLRQIIPSVIARQVASLRDQCSESCQRECRERCTALLGESCNVATRAVQAAILAGSGREAEARSAEWRRAVHRPLSFARGYVFEPIVELRAPSFALAETARGATVTSARFLQRAAKSSKYVEMRTRLQEASSVLAALAQEGAPHDAFARARAERESAERDLVELAREISGGREPSFAIDVDSLARQLEPRQVAISFCAFERTGIELAEAPDRAGPPVVNETRVWSMAAFVVRRSAEHEPQLSVVDLGPLAPFEEAVSAWRDALGVAGASRGVGALSADSSQSKVDAHGRRLRELILDPLLPWISDAQSVTVVLEHVLALLPFDALPLEGGELAGDRWRIETRVTLTELVHSSEPLAAVAGEGGPRARFIAFGGVDYGERESDSTAIAQADVGRMSLLRGGAWDAGFTALPGTAAEVRDIARCFGERFGDTAQAELCEGAGATRDRLVSLAPQARFLHVATHGWFAPESIPSWSDSAPIDRLAGIDRRVTRETELKEMSPMLLCGLALANANARGTTNAESGLITAEEISALDLSSCELAVLSACDTNVGVQRAGQGVASLQRALQMAGARSVITSLWKVPDEATKDLMLDFYRRLWIERKPKWQALWEAKATMRNAKDARGAPLYATRDWAAWVLTGAPR